MNTLQQVLEYGMIGYADDEIGLLVTVNGAYFNIWWGTPANGYTNTDCVGVEKDMYKTTAAAAWDGCKEIGKRLSNGEDLFEED